jgi:hypothetical protein
MSQRQHYSKSPIPARADAENPEEILPGDGKIFTTIVPAAKLSAPCPTLPCLNVTLLLHYRGKS